MLIRKHVYQEGAGDGTGGGGGGSGTPPNTPPKGPETFTREYVTELRNESASYRTRATESDKKAQEAEDRAKKAQEEADSKVKTANDAANQRIIMAELRTAAIKAGMVDLDGLKLADMSKVKLNDKGDVEGADALMEELKKSKPFLFGTGKTSTTNAGDPPKPTGGEKKSARDMDEAVWKQEKKRFGLR